MEKLVRKLFQELKNNKALFRFIKANMLRI